MQLEPFEPLDLAGEDARKDGRADQILVAVGPFGRGPAA